MRIVAVSCREWNPPPEIWRRALQYLPEHEQIVVNKFLHKIDSKKSLLGKLLSRVVLSESTQTCVQDMRFHHNQFGKPFLTNWNGDFNISHHGDWIIVGESVSGNIGVDVVAVEVSPNESQERFLELLKPCLTNTEWNSLENLCQCPSDQLTLFFMFWSLKESYIKAEGLGLSLDPSRIECKVELSDLDSSGEKIELYIDSVKCPYFFKVSRIDENHLYAVGCLDASVYTTNIQVQAVDELLHIAERMFVSPSQ